MTKKKIKQSQKLIIQDTGAKMCNNHDYMVDMISYLGICCWNRSVWHCLDIMDSLCHEVVVDSFVNEKSDFIVNIRQ